MSDPMDSASTVVETTTPLPELKVDDCFWKKQLVSLWQNVNITTHFAAGDYAELPPSRLHIDQYGPVSLPLSERDVPLLINLVSKSPFGLGDQTLVDERVRGSWQLDSLVITFLKATILFVNRMH